MVKKVQSILAIDNYKEIFFLLLLMVVGMLVETFSIALIIPAMSLMTDSSVLEQYVWLAPWLKFMGNPTTEELVIIGMFALVLVYAFKSIFLAFLAWKQVHFAYSLQADMSSRLFSGYLRQPYTFHLQRNTAELIRNVMGQVGDMTHVVQQSLVLITELLILLGILFLLVWVEPTGSILAIGIIGLIGYVGQRLSRTKLLTMGEIKQACEKQRIQQIQQGLSGIKDAKLLGREMYFHAEYDLHNIGSANATKVQVFFKALPRFGLEFLAVTGLAVIVITMIIRGEEMGAILPTLGVFAAASFRLLPSFNRVLMATQALRFFSPVIDTLHSEFNLFENKQSLQEKSHIAFTNVLTIDHVSFKYSSSQESALHDINLEITAGSSIGIVGSSGSGKSTLVDIILGLLTPSSGYVKIDGMDTQINIRSWQDEIGYVPQTIFLTDDTLRRNIAFGVPDEQIDDLLISSAVQSAQLEDFVKKLPEGLDAKVGERGVRLSGGQRQRIGIARALYHNPKVLVLDEATSSLDTETESSFMGAVRAFHGKKTIIIVAHRLSTVENCDYIYQLSNGKIVKEGSLEKVLGRVST